MQNAHSCLNTEKADLGQLFAAYAVLVYAMMLYAVMATLWLHSSRFSWCGDRVLRVKIQKLSLLFSIVCCSCGSSQSPSLADPPWCAWSSWQKWAATGFSAFVVHMSERCSLIFTCRVFSISPTYCRLHILHVMLLWMWYFLLVIWLSNVFLSPFLDSTYTVSCYICCCRC